MFAVVLETQQTLVKSFRLPQLERFPFASACTWRRLEIPGSAWEALRTWVKDPLASLFLVAMPGATSSLLLLLAMPFVTSSLLVLSSDSRYINVLTCSDVKLELERQDSKA